MCDSGNHIPHAEDHDLKYQNLNVCARSSNLESSLFLRHYKIGSEGVVASHRSLSLMSWRIARTIYPNDSVFLSSSTILHRREHQNFLWRCPDSASLHKLHYVLVVLSNFKSP